MNRRILILILSGLLFFLGGCKTASDGMRPLDVAPLYEKLAEMEDLIANSPIGTEDNTYPQSAYDELLAARDELMLGISKANAGYFILQFEIDNYVIAADKAIAAFRNSLQITLEPGTPASLTVFGIDSAGRIEFGESPLFGAGQAWSVESWMRYDSGFFECGIADFISTFSWREDGTSEGWMVNFMGSGLRTTIGMGPQTGRVFEWSGNYPTNYGEWNHVVAVYDATATDGQLKMYLNGELFWSKVNDIVDGSGVQQQYQPTSSNLKMWAFQRPADPTCCMTGGIRNFRLWSKALSAVEVAELMNSEVTGSEAGLVCAWDFDVVPENPEAIADKTGRFSAKLVGRYKWTALE